MGVAITPMKRIKREQDWTERMARPTDMATVDWIRLWLLPLMQLQIRRVSNGIKNTASATLTNDTAMAPINLKAKHSIVE